MNARFSRPVHLTSRVVSGLIVGAALGVMLAVVLLTRLDAISTSPQDPSRTTSSDPVRQAIEQHHCSTRGFGSGAIPSSALIRTAAGDLLLVSFDRGWKVYQDRQNAADLVAVCLDDLPPGVAERRP